MKNRINVAVVGAGAAGIATAVALQRAGITDFEVFESSAGPGGTWWDNTYPGCEVDIHSQFYSFSFMSYDWSRTHAPQAELRDYMQATIDHFQISRRFRFGSRVQSAVWQDEDQKWALTIEGHPPKIFDAVISAVGFLNTPRYPDWAADGSFEGPIFHTARWEHDQDLSGKRVAYVGTGSTCSQVVPAIAPVVEHLYVFQREPGWVLPKADRYYTPEERKAFRRSRLARKRARFVQFRTANRLLKGLWREGTQLNTELRNTALKYINETIEDEDTRRAVTPNFAFGCKRTIQSSDYYPALNRSNVTLVPNAVDGLLPSGVVSNGTKYDVDVVILGTGFQAQNYLATIDIRGRNGVSLQQYWNGTPMAFLGAAVPHFPNFFMVFGPNTAGGGSSIYQIEKSAGLAVRQLGRLGRRATVEVRESAYRRYNQVLDAYIERTLTAQTQCHNYYFSPTGRNVTQWPASHLAFAVACRLLPGVAMRTRSR